MKIIDQIEVPKKATRKPRYRFINEMAPIPKNHIVIGYRMVIKNNKLISLKSKGTVCAPAYLYKNMMALLGEIVGSDSGGAKYVFLPKTTNLTEEHK